jgi:hypothetical protein
MSMLTDEADRLAAAAAESDDNEPSETGDESAPASPQFVTVNLGDRTVQLPAEAADDVRRAFDTMAGRYGSELESFRRASQQPQPVYIQQTPSNGSGPAYGFKVPDPDLLFSKKELWERGIEEQLAARDAQLRQETQALVHTAMGIVQQELNMREQRQAAGDYEAQLREAVFDKHEILRDKEPFFNAVFDEIYDDIRHLPANVAYDRAGEIAEARWTAMGVGGTANGNGVNSLTATRPATPRLLSGARAAGGTAAAPPSRASITDRILERQERFLSGRAPTK